MKTALAVGLILALIYVSGWAVTYGVCFSLERQAALKSHREMNHAGVIKIAIAWPCHFWKTLWR
jgi:hypothetical protein